MIHGLLSFPIVAEVDLGYLEVGAAIAEAYGTPEPGQGLGYFSPVPKNTANVVCGRRIAATIGSSIPIESSIFVNSHSFTKIVRAADHEEGGNDSSSGSR